MIKMFTDLEVYQRSKELYSEIIKLTSTYPTEAKYIKDQTCRAANSIHANIAEGYGRSIAEFKNYLTRALGSCNEVLSHLDDSYRIARYSDEQKTKDLNDKYSVLGKQIYTLRQNWK